MSDAGKPYRVFVVDDEQVIASSLAEILCQRGFDATPFTEPLEALRAARSQFPDLLISDVAMPVLSGIELATQVQGHCPNCKVLLFSGQLSTIHLLEAAREYGRDFVVLQKPVHPTDLLKKIQMQLGIQAPLGTEAQLEIGS
jgi:DNA-binding NtrC family response regulator